MTLWNSTKTALLLLTTLVCAPNCSAQQAQGYPIDQDSEELRRDALPQVEAGRFKLPALEAPSIATDNIGNGRIPDGFRGEDNPPIEPLPETASERYDGWDWSVCSWAAPNTFSNPRYFEDRMLERHGHERWHVIQPLVGGVRFFGQTAMWPYLASLRNPCDCEYTVGYFRPGSCAPALMQRPPCDRAAILTQGTTVAGLIVAFP